MIKCAAPFLALSALFVPPLLAQDGGGGANQPPEHVEPFPNLAIGKGREKARESFDLAPHLERGTPATQMLEQNRRLSRALAALEPQRPGTVDAYIVSIALDSDPVFAREAREAAKVLGRRYGGSDGGKGRILTRAGPDGQSDDLARGSIRSMILGLAHMAELMDRDEDVLVVYTTSHGSQLGLVNHFGDNEYGIFSPTRLQKVFAELGIKRRLLIISACYSGIFLPKLSGPDTAILTAAAAQRTSFGCAPENDWTFYGDALINRSLRKPQSLADAAKETSRQIAEWESSRRLLASLPQTAIGDGAKVWLAQLESRMPQTATDPVGRPSVGE
ncbi:peptidase C13 [Erythrobacter insulae]|uniref:Peptidase C13 n=1 Tax=Erythrobacter insulae TaxID=2584124 RepID=A0A547PEB5_9SPHN|nr:C13 family peptidase [Erythrobacter insulae]TRD12468.1 peptidase C13 [Erythrobacter insulae]